jgi:purine catabolism regulator
VVAASEGADLPAKSVTSSAAVDSQPVDVLATRWGELLAYGPPDDRRRTVLERGAVAVALELSRSGAAGTARVAGRELLRDAALNRLGSLAELTLRAEALGLVMRPGHHLLALCVTPEQSDALPAVVGAAAAAARQILGASALVADVEDDVVAVAFVARTTEPDGVRAVVERFAEQLDARVPARRTTVTAGPVGSDVASLATSVIAAREVSRLARRLGSHPRVLLAADIGVHRLLSRLVEHAELETFIDEQIGTLLEHDARLGRDLVRTLEAYFDQGLSKTRAAEALGIRRQTLYARLERIEALLGGLDLHRRERRTALDLALVAWRLRGSAVGQRRRER